MTYHEGYDPELHPDDPPYDRCPMCGAVIGGIIGLVIGLALYGGAMIIAALLP